MNKLQKAGAIAGVTFASLFMLGKDANDPASQGPSVKDLFTDTVLSLGVGGLAYAFSKNKKDLVLNEEQRRQMSTGNRFKNTGIKNG